MSNENRVHKLKLWNKTKRTTEYLFNVPSNISHSISMTIGYIWRTKITCAQNVNAEHMESNVLWNICTATIDVCNVYDNKKKKKIQIYIGWHRLRFCICYEWWACVRCKLMNSRCFDFWLSHIPMLTQLIQFKCSSQKGRWAAANRFQRVQIKKKICD